MLPARIANVARGVSPLTVVRHGHRMSSCTCRCISSALNTRCSRGRNSLFSRNSGARLLLGEHHSSDGLLRQLLRLHVRLPLAALPKERRVQLIHMLLHAYGGLRVHEGLIGQRVAQRGLARSTRPTKQDRKLVQGVQPGAQGRREVLQQQVSQSANQNDHPWKDEAMKVSQNFWQEQSRNIFDKQLVNDSSNT